MATTDNRLPTEGTQIDIEARLAAIETALASLMADTTGQSIASAISGLGQTLGSDRALIDGSNIANPSAFRQSLGIESMTNAIKTFTLKANSSYTISFRNTFKSMILLGFAQGIGNVILSISAVGSSVDSVRNLISLSNFSNSALTFSATTDTITISSNNSSVSRFTAILGNVN